MPSKAPDELFTTTLLFRYELPLDTVLVIESVGVKVGIVWSGKFDIVKKLFRLSIFVCLVSSAVCNPVVLAIVSDASVIVFCFASNRVIIDVPPNVMFPSTTRFVSRVVVVEPT